MYSCKIYIDFLLLSSPYLDGSCKPMPGAPSHLFYIALKPNGTPGDPKATPLTQKFDARTGITTGISAYDRTRTVQVVVDDRSTPADLVRGHGHMDGLRARDGHGARDARLRRRLGGAW